MDVKEEILAALRPQDVYGEDLLPSTNGYKTVCPFPSHDDKDPSLHIRAENMSFHCFGCKESGDAFTFIMKREGLDFMGALHYLAEITGISIKTGKSKYARLYEANKAALEHYEDELARSEKILTYLTLDRHISHESIKKFHIGYSNNTSLVRKLRDAGYTDDEILKAGLAKKKGSDPRDFFWNRIMFPIVVGAKVRGFGGRALDNETPKFINTQATEIFKKKELLYGLNSYAVKEKGYAIVVEGYIDVIIAHQKGYTNTVAPLGTALTKEQAELLKKYCNRIYLIFDGDSAGLTAARRTAKLMFDMKINGGVVVLPEGHDPDTYLLAGHSINDDIGRAIPFSVFLVRNFPEDRKMIFSSLIKRRKPTEIAEFVSLMGSPEEANQFMEFSARTFMDGIVKKKSYLVIRQKEIEIRKYDKYLLLYSHKRFLMWQMIKGDEKKQAEEMMNTVLGYRKKHAEANTK